jgi:hypothetical protein
LNLGRLDTLSLLAKQARATFFKYMNSESKRQIIERRKEIEGEIIELLKLTRSDFTLDDVKTAIYEEEDSDDMQKIIAMFDDGDPINLNNAIETVTDAGNYFPHKVLGGLSPAEMM